MMTAENKPADDQPAPDFSVKGIDQEALQRLDAEIEAQARAKAEQQAAAGRPAAALTPQPNTAAGLDDARAPTIREYLDSTSIKALNARILAACRKYGISLDSPWPPHFPAKGKPEPQLAPAPTATLIQLDVWEDGRRAAPNIVFRSALFPALNPKQERRYLDQERIFTTKGGEIYFTGKQFDQSDLDVYLEILQFARPFPLGTPVRFSAYALLKALGRNTGKSDREWLHTVIIRLCGGVVDMTDHTKRYFGQLLYGGIRDEITTHYEITLNPKFAILFGFGLWSALDKEQRRALKRNQTAKALHAYYASHAAPGPHEYGTLAEIAGLKNRNHRDIKATLIAAHEELKRVEFLSDYEAGATTIKVTINHTPGQNRHIVVKKIIKSRKAKKGTG